MNPEEIIRQHFAALGKRGGSAKSAAKAKACRENAKKKRVRKPKTVSDLQTDKETDVK